MTHDDGYCHCPEPLTDAEVEAASTGDPEEDFCWACGRPIDTDAQPEPGR